MIDVTRSACIAACALTLFGCGPSNGVIEEEPAAAPETSPTTGAEDESDPEQWAAWSELPDDQKGRYMQEIVLPQMSELFAGFESDHIPDTLTCASCHGDDAQEVGFRMPNGLHPLDPDGVEGLFTSDDPEIARIAQFMGGPVEHTMADLLSMEPYDPETHEGFGCFHCHERAPL